ncbi:MAG: PQQ-binding-like beta-propeller repeat protein [Phycisphaerales bacterium JB061]
MTWCDFRASFTACLSAACGAMPGQAIAQPVEYGHKLVASDADDRDSFGRDVAVRDGIVAVGSVEDDDMGLNSGAVYLYDAQTGMELRKIVPLSSSASDEIGWSITIENGAVFFGTIYDDDNGTDSGAVYQYDIATGSEIRKIVPQDTRPGLNFGGAIDVHDGVLAVAAVGDDISGTLSGAVYLFDATTGAQLHKLSPSDGAERDYFGSSVALSNGYLWVTAAYDDDDGEDSGSAYVFDVLTGEELFKVKPDDGEPSKFFGVRAAADNGIVVIGAPLDNEVAMYSGAAYVFDIATGAQLDKLLPDEGQALDFFGSSVAIDGGLIVSGSPRDDDNGSGAGSAHLFDAASGDRIDVLYPPKPGDGGELGSAVAIHNGVVVAGETGNDDFGPSSGAAHTFRVVQECLADTNHDGMLTPTDFTAWIANYNAGCP